MQHIPYPQGTRESQLGPGWRVRSCLWKDYSEPALAKGAAFIHLLHLCGTRSWGFLCPLFRWKVGLRHEYLTLPRMGSRFHCSLCPLPGGIFCPGRWQGQGRAGRCKRGSSGHEKTRAARALGRQIWAAGRTCCTCPGSMWRSCLA